MQAKKFAGGSSFRHVATTSWSMTLEAEWVTIWVSLALACIAAAWTVWGARRGLVRKQARAVSCWVERDVGNRTVSVVRNSSDDPIYDVLIFVIRAGNEVETASEGDRELITAGIVGPQRAVPFPVSLSAPDARIRAHAYLMFTDARSRSRTRDARGKLRKGRAKGGLSDIFQRKIIKDPGSRSEPIGGPSTEASTHPYGRQRLRADGGNEIVIRFLGDDVEVEQAIEATVSLENQLRATIAATEDWRIVEITLHNLPSFDNRIAAARRGSRVFELLKNETDDSLLILFDSRPRESFLDGVDNVLPLPSLGPQINPGHLLYDGEEIAAIRIARMHEVMHPSFVQEADTKP